MNLIKFKQLAWEIPRQGVKQKIHSNGQSRLRLIQFDDTFVEEDWCSKGHVGYVVEGEMTINVNGAMNTYKKGDGLWLEQGESNQHKVIIEKGKRVELILFESEE